MTMHGEYWSCSRVADVIRGTPKPSGGTAKEWRSWRQAAKAAHPYRYWVVEEAFDKVQDIFTWIPDQLNSIRHYLNNRFVSKTHALTSHPRDIARGSWRDVGDRFLPCMFNELVNFVEIENAWMHVAWDEETYKKYNVPWWRKHWWSRWGLQWRCPEAGLAHLDWEIGLTYDESLFVDPDDPLYGTPTTQALKAKEIKDLYLWWTTVYPNRPDPYDVGGWSALCETRRSQFDDILWEDETDEQQKETRSSLERTHEIEAAYEAEDTLMLKRLIDIRKSLWT